MPFIMVDHEVLALAAKIGSKALHVYCALAKYADKQGVCWPSVGLLSKETGINRRDIFRAIDKLKQYKLVKTRYTGRSNIYELLMLPPKSSAGVPNTHPHQRTCATGGTPGVPNTAHRTISKELNPLVKDSLYGVVNTNGNTNAYTPRDDIGKPHCQPLGDGKWRSWDEVYHILAKNVGLE